MLIKKAEDIRSSEITPKSLYLNRAQVSRGGSNGRSRGGATGCGTAGDNSPSTSVFAGNKIDGIKEEFVQHDRDDHALQRRDALQQLLRVRHRER